VLAHGGGTAYRIGKFLRRHRAGSVLAAVALCAILTASGVALWQARIARRAAADQQELNAFLMDVLAMSDPFNEGEDITLSEALDRAVDKIDERFAGRPDLSAQVRYGIGYSMASRYRLEQAEVQLERALAESITQFGRNDLRTLRALDGVAGLRLEQGRFDEAKQGYRQVIDALEDQRATDTSLYVNALGNLANVHLQEEDYAEADRLLQKALAANAERSDTGRAADQAALLSNLAHAVHGLEDLPRAARHYTEAQQAYLALFPQGSPDLAILYNNHALLLEESGDAQRALEMHQRSLDMRRKVFRNEHPMVVSALSNVARLQLRSGDAAGALVHADEGAAMADRVYTAPNRFHPSIHATLADARLALDDLAGARSALWRARQLLAEMGEDTPPSTARWVEEVGMRVCARDAASCAGR
jgi:tetratricopeptide (TPR) repeat protein